MGAGGVEVWLVDEWVRSATAAAMSVAAVVVGPVDEEHLAAAVVAYEAGQIDGPELVARVEAAGRERLRLATAGAHPQGDVVKRSRTVAVRLNELEWSAWVTGAAGDGRREVGRWVRERINEQLRTGPYRGPGSGGPAAAGGRVDGAGLAALTRIGNNVNQAVRYAHGVAVGGRDQGDAVEQLAAAIEGAVGELRLLREQLRTGEGAGS